MLSSPSIQGRVEEILSIDSVADYAILKVDPPSGHTLQQATLGDSDALAVGETIVVMGNPKGYHEKMVSTGIISARRPDRKRIQMTTLISWGSSGGLVFNLKGEVIGISVE